MITRISQARVRPERLDDFMAALLTLVTPFPERFDGLLDHEVLVDLDDPTVVLYLSRWRDEAAVAEFAGPAWRTDPVTFPGEEHLLLGPLTLSHLREA